MRIGHGFDAHRLVAQQPLMLGGILIPHDHGLKSHSDGDVVIHALCDALLGALALGDIGQHFPPHDPRYKQLSSRHFLQQVAALIGQHGYVAHNIDITIIAERPKLMPYVQAMRENLSLILGISLEYVSVKATTSDTLGFIGRQEGIAAVAVVLLTPSR